MNIMELKCVLELENNNDNDNELVYCNDKDIAYNKCKWYRWTTHWITSKDRYIIGIIGG